MNYQQRKLAFIRELRDRARANVLEEHLEVTAVWQMLIEGYDPPDSDWELVYRHRSEDHQALTFPEYKSLMMP
jgi:hypothetical protein